MATPTERPVVGSELFLMGERGAGRDGEGEGRKGIEGAQTCEDQVGVLAPPRCIAPLEVELEKPGDIYAESSYMQRKKSSVYRDLHAPKQHGLRRTTYHKQDYCSQPN